MEPGRTRHLFTKIKPAAPTILFACIDDGTEAAIIIERHAAMEEQIAVAAQVHIPLLIEVIHMAVQHSAFEEVRAQIRHDCLLGFRQRIDIFLPIRCIDGREIRAFQLIPFSITELNMRGTKINAVEQTAALHLEIRMAGNQLAFQFEHHHRDGSLSSFDGCFIRINACRKCRERAQADAITPFQHVGIMIAQGIAYNCCNTGLAAKCRPHPEHIVIAPLDIHGGMLHQEIEDGIRTVATVEEIANDMQPVDRQAFDEDGECLDEIRTAVNLHDRIEQFLKIDELCLIGFRPCIHEFDNDRGIPLGYEATNLRSRVFIAHELGEFEQPRQVLPIPCRRCPPCFAHLLHLFPRIINQGTEFRFLLFGQPYAKDIIDFLPDDAGAIVEDVKKRRIFAMQIAHEMLDAFGQREIRLQIDDFLVNGFLCGILLCHQAQDLADFLACIGGVGIHHAASLHSLETVSILI